MMQPNAAPVAAGIDFSRLSAHWRILTTSPAWPEVVAAMQRMDAAPPAPPLPQDVATVREYAAILRRDADTVGRALVVGYAIGCIAGGQRAERIAAGLDALSAGHHFERLDTTAVRKALLSVGSELTRRFSYPLADEYGFEEDPSGNHQLTQAVSTIRYIEGLRTGSPLDGVGLARDAWESAGERLHFLLTASGAPPPTLAELMCHASRIGPGLWLDPDPATMTISEWTRLARAAGGGGDLLRAVPGWAALAALGALGFGEESLARMRETVAAGPSTAGTAFHEMRARARPLRLALVVTRGEDSALHQWMPIAELAALVLDVSEIYGFDTLYGRMLPDPDRVEGGLHVAVELTPDQQEPPELERVLRGLLSKYPRIDIFPEPPRRDPVRPFIVAPQGPADLLRGILNQGEGAMRKALA